MITMWNKLFIPNPSHCFPNFPFFGGFFGMIGLGGQGLGRYIGDNIVVYPPTENPGSGYTTPGGIGIVIIRF